MIAVNFQNPDKGKVARNIVVWLNYTLKEVIEWLEEEDDGDKKEILT